MRVLLDSHAVLWWASGRASQLTPRAHEVIEDGQTTALVGAGSLYEIALKASIGRLELPDEPEAYLPRLLRRHRFGVLPVVQAHAIRAGSLPWIHRDPWDRLLIAQAMVESLPIVTADPAIGRYDVEVIW
jgi:PIN domain nuclease of toxin-antitoxin system